MITTEKIAIRGIVLGTKDVMLAVRVVVLIIQDIVLAIGEKDRLATCERCCK